MKKTNFTQRLALSLLNWAVALLLPLFAVQQAQAQSSYTISVCGNAFNNISTTGAFLGALSQGDDNAIALPVGGTGLPAGFVFNFYNQPITTMTATTNGFISFPGGIAGAPFTNANLVAGNRGLFPFWDDLNLGTGMWTQTIGVAPNRTFIVQWNKALFGGVATDVGTFQVQLSETTSQIRFIYQDVIFGAASINNFGGSATIGVAGPLTALCNPVAQYSFNQATILNPTPPGVFAPNVSCLLFTPSAVCTVVPAANITASTSATACTANVTTPVPTLAGTCPAGTFQYRVDGGPPVAVPAGTPTVTIVGLTGGTHTILWELVPSACPISATQTITVLDLVPPVITCPANIVTTLGPGDCSAFVNYPAPTVTDNCPFIGPPATLATGLVNNNINNVGGDVFFDLVNLTAGPLTITGMSTRITVASVVEIFTKSGTGFGFEANAGAWTLTATGNAPAGLLPFPITFTIPPGVTGIAVHPVTAASQYTNGIPAVAGPYGISTNGTFTDGTITIRAGATLNVHFTGVPFNPRIWNGSVTYQTIADATPIQGNPPGGPDCCTSPTGGLPSGAEFEIGTTQNCFYVFDAANPPNLASCCFTVTVNEFPNPTTTLVCNDLVQISLDEDCSSVIGADQILEGGPYGCYEDYIVMVLGPVGQNLGNTVTSAFIGTTWTVKVIDPETGNACWGQIIVEDKLPPTIVCHDIVVPCTTLPGDIAVDPFPPLVGPQVITYENVDEPLGEAGAPVPDAHTYDFDYSYIPPGCPVLDVDVRVQLTGHTQHPQLDMILISPSGQQQLLYEITGCFGAVFNVNVTWDDEGMAGVTLCVQLDAAGAPMQCFILPGVQNNSILDNFDGTNASGIWRVRFVDNVAGAQGLIETVGMRLTVNCPAIAPADNCTNPPIITFVDNFEDGDCGGPSGTIVRQYTATDASGNSASCTQNIIFDRPTLDEVAFPSDIKWTCEQYEAYPNIIEPTALHPYITDSDPATLIIDVNLDPNCDDDDNAARDHAGVNSTNVANGGNGCPGQVLDFSAPFDPNSGIDDADVLALTGSGLPTVDGKPLVDICGIGYNHVDLLVPVCPGTFKIIRKWTLIDWCANPVAVSEFNQVIKVVDDEGPQIKMVNQDTLHQVYTVGSLGPLVVNGVNTTVTVTNSTWTIGDTTVIVFQGGNPISWTVVEDVILIPPSVKLKLRTFSFVTALNINVYDASVPSGSPHASCEGNFVAPPAVDMGDNCSGVAGFTTVLFTAVGNPLVAGVLLQTHAGNGGVFTDVPLFVNGLAAKYVLRYYSVDGCGNQSHIDIVITLIDKVPPVAVCDEVTEVSITNNGLGTGNSCSTLYAEDLDDGSYDNCKPVYFLAAQMNQSFSPTIFNRCYYPTLDFCCDDIGEQTVILLVLDGNPAPFFTNLNSPSLGCNGTPGLFLTTSFSALNYNTCMVTVQVTDKLPPILVSCPANQRITCDWYTLNLETQLAGLTGAQQCSFLTQYFGAPTFFDNCATNINCTTSINLDQCLEGTLSRTWTATDNAGNAGLQSCTQTIFVDHVSDWVVEFPADITVICGNNVPDFGVPEIFYETCELVGVSHEDVVFTTVPDACYKLARRWTVINWCVVGQLIDQEVVEQPENQLGLPFPLCDLDGDGDCDPRTFRDSWRGTAPVPNPFAPTAYRLRPGASDATAQTNPDTDLDTDPWDGYITYEQTIKVIDNVDPVFVNGCQIPDVCIVDNTCAATVLLPTPEVQECSDLVTITVQIQIGGVWLNGFGPYFGVAPGTYPVRYLAADNCNNQTQCLSSVTVKDCKKPTPYCEYGLVVELMVVDPPMVQVWAVDFNVGSFDNCPGALKFSFSSDVNDLGVTYTCDDLGQQPVQVWVTDAAGNQDYCETFVVIQANMGQCDDDPLVAGLTSTETNAGVGGVSVNINSPSGFDNTSTTNASGAYGPVTVPNLGDYTITPVYDVEPLNGVSTFDLVLISKHILGVAPLGSPYKIIAADANKSNTVTTFDLVEIRKLILFINTDFPNNTSWRFVDKDHVFANPSNPFQGQFPEVINLNDLTADALAENFVAIKVGDVNGSAATNLTGSVEDRTTFGDLVFNVDDENVAAGETYLVEFKATDFHVSGYQFTLNFERESLEFVEVAPAVADASNFGMSLLNEGVITASWNSDEAKQLAAGDVVFTLVFKGRQAGRLSDLLGVSSRYTAAEAYNGSSQLLNVGLSFNHQLVGAGFELYQNTPNPFANATVIGFHLPEATSATLTLSDVSGKVLKVIAGDYSKGYHEVSVKRSELGASGVLNYRLDTDQDSATRRMILVD